MLQTGSLPPRFFALVATVFGALGVVLGAFGAHVLRGTIDDAALQVWRTAVDYQFWHALALLMISLSPLPPTRWLRASGLAFIVGIVLFCGSLYALALGAPHIAGLITPLGGVALIAAWVLTFIALWRGLR
jgi:uncharacterized membrane protein YgdD (TMEM256/DUF423 family)